MLRCIVAHHMLWCERGAIDEALPFRHPRQDSVRALVHRPMCPKNEFEDPYTFLSLRLRAHTKHVPKSAYG